MKNTGTIVDVRSVTNRYATPFSGPKGRSYGKEPYGYVNGYGARCWTESYVYLYWVNDKSGKRQCQDIRDKIKDETGGAVLTQKRLSKFLELNKGKKVELCWEDDSWKVANLDELNYDFIN